MVASITVLETAHGTQASIMQMHLKEVQVAEINKAVFSHKSHDYQCDMSTL